MHWHKEAREMRRMGLWTLKEIADKFGVTPQRVQQVCRDIYCPIDHRATRNSLGMKRRWQDPNFRRNQIEAILRGRGLSGANALENEEVA